MSFINSWNTDLIEVNGVAFTNKWSNSLPAAIDGKWYIHYKASLAWAHFEAPSAKDAESIINQSDIQLFPNPFSTSINLSISSIENLKTIKVFNQQGQLIRIIDSSEFAGNSIEIGYDLSNGLYIIQIIENGSTRTFKIIKGL